MRIRNIFILLFVTTAAIGQQINPVPDYIFRNQMSVGRNAPTDTAAYLSVGPRFGAVKGLMPPMVVDTNAVTGVKRNGLLIFSVQLNNFAYWDSTTSRFRKITAEAVVDSVLFATRAWRKKGDDSLAAIINTRTDTALLSTKAYRQKGIDSVVTLISTLGGGTVLSVSAGTGMNFTTITTLGAVNADTNVLATRANRDKLKDSLNANIALKVNISDTSTMLGAYLRKADTTSMLTPYLRKGDTTAMLAPYVRIAGFGLTKGTQTLSADSALMATRARVQKGIDSVASLIVAPTIDSLEWSTRDWRQKGVDSVAALANTKATATGTTNYLSKFTGTSSLGNSIVYATTSEVGISTPSPTHPLDVNGRVRVRTIDSVSSPINMVTVDNDGVIKKAAVPSLAVDSVLYSTRAWRQKGDDSLAAIIATKGSGTVTSVATGVGLTGGTITSTGTISADTLSLSTRAWRQKAVDSLQANINAKGSGTVTSVGSGFGTNFSTITTTGSVVVDSLVMTSRASRDKLKDSLQANINAKGSGTVTSVSAGTGMSFTTITSTGAVNADTVTLATRARVQKAVDSLGSVKQNTLTNPVTGTGTTNYVPKFTGTSTIGNSLLYDDGSGLGLGTTSPTIYSGAKFTQYQASGNSLMAIVSGDSTQFSGFYVAGNNLTNNWFQFRQYSSAASGTLMGINVAGSQSLFTSGTSTGPLMFLQQANQPIAFGTNNTERMRLTGNGTMLLGTTTDNGQTLQVNGTSRLAGATQVTGQLTFNAFSGSYSGYGIARNGNVLLLNTGSDGLLVNNDANSANLFAIKNNANTIVGGTTDVGYKLDVQGNLRTTTGANFATSSGSVGIGLESPLRKLHMNDTALIRAIIIDTVNGMAFSQSQVSASPFMMRGSPAIFNTTDANGFVSSMNFATNRFGDSALRTGNEVFQFIFRSKFRDNQTNWQTLDSARMGQYKILFTKWGNDLPSARHQFISRDSLSVATTFLDINPVGKLITAGTNFYTTGTSRIGSIDSTASAINMLYADANGVIKKTAVPSSGVTMSEDVATIESGWNFSRPYNSPTPTSQVVKTSDGSITTVSINIAVHKTTATFSEDSWVKVASLPSGFRPNNTIHGQLASIVDGDEFQSQSNVQFGGTMKTTGHMAFRIQPDGDVQVNVDQVTSSVTLSGSNYVLFPIAITFPVLALNN